MSFLHDLNSILDLFNNREELHRNHQENFTREIKERVLKLKSVYPQNKEISTISAIIGYSNENDILSRLDNSTYFFEVIFL